MSSLLEKYRAEKEGQLDVEKYIDSKVPLTPEEIIRKQVEDREYNLRNNIIIQTVDSNLRRNRPTKYIDSISGISIETFPEVTKPTTSTTAPVEQSENSYVENNYIDNYFI